MLGQNPQREEERIRFRQAREFYELDKATAPNEEARQKAIRRFNAAHRRWSKFK